MNDRNSDDKPVILPQPTSTEVQKDKAEAELKEVVAQSHEALVKVNTVFPFTLFPDTIAIDRTKLTIVTRVFFYVADVVNVNLQDILNITPHVGPFFGSLEIHTKYFEADKSYNINFLWRRDAIRVHRILLGYKIALEKKIDTSSLETKELADMLDELGKNLASP